MTIMVRDPWVDAQVVASGAPLDERLVAARRRLRLVRFGGIALGLAVLGVYFAVTDRIVGGEAYTLWTTEDGLLRARMWVLGAGAVLILVGFLTSLRAGVPSGLLAPQDYLPADERRWLRRVLASGGAVHEERRTVVEDAAGRDVKEAARLPEHLGWVLLLGSISLTTPEPLVLAPFVLLVGRRPRSPARSAPTGRDAGSPPTPEPALSAACRSPSSARRARGCCRRSRRRRRR